MGDMDLGGGYEALASIEAAFRDNEIDDTIAPSLTAGVVLGRALLLSQIR